MSLLEGSATTTRFRITEPPTGAFIEMLKSGAFISRTLENGESNVGFCVCGNELSTDFDSDNFSLGEFKIFSFMREKLTVSKKELDLRIALRGSQEGGILSRIHRKELTEEITIDLEKTTAPKKTVVQICR